MTKTAMLIGVMLTGAILLLSAPGLCATVGSLPTDPNMANVFGLGDVRVPLGTSYPDFAFTCTRPYLVFGGNYNQLQWDDWKHSVKHYKVEVRDWSTWTGVWVAGRGDLNGDENNDLLIGDPRHLNFRAWDKNYGICYALYNIGEPGFVGETVLHPDAAGTMATVAMIMTDQAQSRFGCCSQIVGDVNGDGYGDILIGESGWGPPTTATAYRERYECGRACLFYGSDDLADTGTTSATVTLLTGENRNDHFGAAVSTAGLLNDDDGYADFAIGAPWYDKVSGETVTGNAGRVYVFLGDADGITGTEAADADYLITGLHEGERLGISVTDLQHVDGNEDSDVGVVASGYVMIHDDDEN